MNLKYKIIFFFLVVCQIFAVLILNTDLTTPIFYCIVVFSVAVLFFLVFKILELINKIVISASCGSVIATTIWIYHFGNSNVDKALIILFIISNLLAIVLVLLAEQSNTNHLKRSVGTWITTILALAILIFPFIFYLVSGIIERNFALSTKFGICLISSLVSSFGFLTFERYFLLFRAYPKSKFESSSDVSIDQMMKKTNFQFFQKIARFFGYYKSQRNLIILVLIFCEYKILLLPNSENNIVTITFKLIIGSIAIFSSYFNLISESNREK